MSSHNSVDLEPAKYYLTNIEAFKAAISSLDQATHSVELGPASQKLLRDIKKAFEVTLNEKLSVAGDHGPDDLSDPIKPEEFEGLFAHTRPPHDHGQANIVMSKPGRTPLPTSRPSLPSSGNSFSIPLPLSACVNAGAVGVASSPVLPPARAFSAPSTPPMSAPHANPHTPQGRPASSQGSAVASPAASTPTPTTLRSRNPHLYTAHCPRCPPDRQPFLPKDLPAHLETHHGFYSDPNHPRARSTDLSYLQRKSKPVLMMELVRDRSLLNKKKTDVTNLESELVNQFGMTTQIVCVHGMGDIHVKHTTDKTKLEALSKQSLVEQLIAVRNALFGSRSIDNELKKLEAMRWKLGSEDVERTDNEV